MMRPFLLKSDQEPPISYCGRTLGEFQKFHAKRKTMSLLTNLSISKKFAFIALSVLVVATLVVVVVNRALSRLGEDSDRAWQRLATTQQIALVNQIRDLMGTTASQMVTNAETLSPAEIQTKVEAIRSQAQQLREALEKAETLLNAVDSERFTTALEESRPTVEAYLNINEELSGLMAANQFAKARTALPRLTKSFLQFGGSIAKLENGVKSDASELRAVTRQAVASTQRILFVATTLAVSLVLVLLFLMTRSITAPMAKMTVAATRIAAGDIDQQMDYQSGDEIGALATAFRELIQYIKSVADAADNISKGDLTVQIEPRSAQDVLAKSFLRMTEDLRATNRQMQESAQVVAAAIGQIFATISQLTASVQETATAVGQTAATIEEVKQIAYSSGHKAKDVSDNAQETARVSQGGKQAIETALTGLNRTREQMQSIADSVIKLGEQSQTIGDIINSVMGLAEQSNLLAVNAAIEAAKAGEQGKGFAVVAQEVRILAEQSKRATGQVRAILSDIQKATNVAVLVTEQGTRAVETGVSQAVEAGESIRSLSQSVTKAAQAVTQIAASSQQQVVGMDQIATAIANIQQATIQNVEGMRQIKNATENLHSVGQTLKHLVERYKVGHNGTSRLSGSYGERQRFA